MADFRGRPIGATATLGRMGYPFIRSATGGELDIVTGPSEPGFNPLDLLLAALAACMSMSARIAARDMGLQNVFKSVKVEARGEKAEEGPSRFERFIVTMTFDGELDEKARMAIAHRTEDICTVSNCLAVRPTILIGAA